MTTSDPHPKKYFVKYLPAEGEIEEGTTVHWDGRSYGKPDEAFETMAGIYTLLSGKNYSGNPAQHPVIEIVRNNQLPLILKVDYNISRNDLTPVKLFLCSREMQVGDKVYTDGNDYGIVLKGFPGCEKMRIKDSFHSGVDYYADQLVKVFGEISPDASWVKEGDEFADNQVLHYKVCHDSPGNTRCCLHCSRTQGCDSTDYIYKIKGPCGHFH